MNMKKLWGVFALGMGLGLTGGAQGAALGDVRVEIPLEGVFAPLHGYDDNDPIEVVFHGVLPNACYSLSDTFYEVSDDGTTVKLHQYAIRRRNDLCAEGAKLPPHLQAAIPFTQSVPIGRLAAGDYQLTYSLLSGGTGTRPLNVARAANSLVDSLPYAVVNTVMVPSAVGDGDEVEVVLSGVLNSSCIELSPEVGVVREKDVIVLLPTVEVKSATEVCAQVVRPFSRVVQLGALNLGETLVHVRSMNGKSMNAIVQTLQRSHR